MSDSAFDKQLALENAARIGSPFAETGGNSRWERAEELLGKASEYLNPILVKEARQALKSKQFLITFILLLICGWAWSMIWVSLNYPGIYYAADGAPMFVGYYWLLAFPMVVIVPFAAFRSLSGEREDGTYELVSITTLRPRQIIAGKLGSSVLQMLMYLSALAPAMTFTYMLRGVDIVMILLVTFYLFLTSLGLSIVGLMLATITKSRHWQMVLGVVFILQLLPLYFYSSVMVSMLISMGDAQPFDRWEFWLIQVTILSFYGGFVAMFFLAATARITFASDNRSTKLRYSMLFIHLLAIGWCVWWWFTVLEEEYVMACLVVVAVYWWLMGSLMVGESDDLSPRVQRELPQTYLGRMFFTWFNPGPGTGYFFATANMLATAFLVFAATFVLHVFPSDDRLSETVVLLAVFVFCYVANYVGLTRLVVKLLSRVAHTSVFLSALLSFLLFLLGIFVPFTVQAFLYGVIGQRFDYTILQLPNPFWVFIALESNQMHDVSIFGFDMPLEPPLLIISAGAMLLINMILTAREVVQQRMSLPQRVVEEEAMLHPKPIVKPAPSNPWEE